MAMVTKDFQRLAELSIKASRHPNLKMVILPHPFQNLAPEKVREIARQKVGEIVDCIVQAPEAPKIEAGARRKP